METTNVIIALLVALSCGLALRLAALRKRLVYAQASVQAASGVVDTVAAEATLQKRRADEFFGIIEGVEKERDNWQRLYRQSSQAAGGAQAWLLRDLTQAVGRGNAYAARLREKGERVDEIRVDPVLAKALEEFSEVHGPGAPEVPQVAALAKAEKVEKLLSEHSLGPK